MAMMSSLVLLALLLSLASQLIATTTTTGLYAPLHAVALQRHRDGGLLSDEEYVAIVASALAVGKQRVAQTLKNAGKKGAAKAISTSLFNRVDKDGKKVLTYYGLMLAGAMARTCSATAVHPLNVCKTMLQTKGGVMPEFKWSVLTRGAGSQFIMSIPHGAINFVVTETTKTQLALMAVNSTLLHKVVPHGFINPLLDFVSSAVSTFICSVVSTPQMVLTDRIMAGVYPDFITAVYTIAQREGIRGFYLGWLPSVVQKIPSYALTWMFFQQLKLVFLSLYGRYGTAIENTLIGSFAAAGACAVMIPVDTIKTRIVTQPPGVQHYTGMVDCFMKILKHEGVWAFYKALTPRLLAVAPMIGIQFSVYELMKRILLDEPLSVVKPIGASSATKGGKKK